MWAKSENRKVVGPLMRVDPATVWPSAEAARYRPAPDDVAIGWDDDGIAFTAPPVTPPPPTVETFHNWLYQHFNEAAQAFGWDDRNTLYARVANPDGKWYPEAKSFADWMDTCERQALDYLASGQPLPATREAFIAMLPTWERPA